MSGLGDWLYGQNWICSTMLLNDPFYHRRVAVEMLRNFLKYLRTAPDEEKSRDGFGHLLSLAE